MKRAYPSDRAPFESAMKLSTDYKWLEELTGIRGTSDRETMADFKLSVGATILTLNRPIEGDSELEEPEQSIRVSLYPLSEFIAVNWWPLLYEPRKQSVDSAEHLSRHDLSRHRGGFAYPRVQLYGADSRIQVVSYAYPLPSAGIEFIASLNTTVSRKDAEQSLLSLLDSVMERISDSEDLKTLQETVAAIRRSQSDLDEQNYCELAGMLGCDPYDADDSIENAILAARDLLGAALAREVFATTDIKTVVRHSHSLIELARSQVKRSKSAAAHVEFLKNLFNRETSKLPSLNPDRPWERGYAGARLLRQLLSIDEQDPLPAMRGLSTKLFDGPSVEALAGFDWQGLGARGVGIEDERGFGIVLDPARNPRFQLAATFADYLFEDNAEIFLSTAAATDRQKMNRAFAAEFLAPAEGIRRTINSRRPRSENLSKVQSQYEVPSHLVRYQIENQAPDLLPYVG
jgi:hypothetical protein